MNIFVWEGLDNGSLGDGTVVVLAESEEAARNLVVARQDKWKELHAHYMVERRKILLVNEHGNEICDGSWNIRRQQDDFKRVIALMPAWDDLQELDVGGHPAVFDLTAPIIVAVNHGNSE